MRSGLLLLAFILSLPLPGVTACRQDQERKPARVGGDALAGTGEATTRSADPGAQRELPPRTIVARSSNGFALDLQQRLTKDDGNLLFSPLSIAAALNMAYLGAEQETAAQMAAVLRIDLGGPRLQEAWSGLLTGLQQQQGVQLLLADRLWGQQGLDFRAVFLRRTREGFGAEPARLDFRGDPGGAAERINDWVSARTGGRIQDLVSPGAFSAQTRLVLTNAVTFAGRWTHVFPESATRQRPFYLLTGDSVQTPLMRQQAAFPYYEEGAFQLLSLPYAGSSLVMVILLPRARDGLPSLLPVLTAPRLRDWLARQEARPVDVSLPRFSLRDRFQLSRVLAQMGMAAAFSPQEADFGGITAEQGIFLNAVIHEAWMEADEEGTEAAAGTAATMSTTSMPAGQTLPPVVFRADHPFLFLIRDLRSQAILFLGQLRTP
jgi:serpin B